MGVEKHSVVWIEWLGKLLFTEAAKLGAEESSGLREVVGEFGINCSVLAKDARDEVDLRPACDALLDGAVHLLIVKTEFLHQAAPPVAFVKTRPGQ